MRGSTKPRCSATVWRDSRHKAQCSRAAKVTRGGQLYCTQHDPDRVAAKGAERKERWAAKSKIAAWERGRKQLGRSLYDAAADGKPLTSLSARAADHEAKKPAGVE